MINYLFCAIYTNICLGDKLLIIFQIKETLTGDCGELEVKMNCICYTKPAAASPNFQNYWLLSYGFIVLMEWKYMEKWFSLWNVTDSS